MLLVILTPGFPENEQDTTCVPYLQDWVLEMQSRNLYTLKILSFQYPFEERTYFWHGIEIYAAGGKNTHFPWRFRTWYKIWQKILVFQQKEPIALLQSFWLTETSFVAQRFAHHYNIPLVMSMLGQDAKPSNKYLTYLNLSNATIISASDFIGGILFSHQKKQSISIPIGMKIKELKNKIPSPKSIDILGVGALIPLKQYDTFIEIIASISVHFPNICAAIIGKGTEKNTLADIIRIKNLEKNLSLWGQIPRNEVFEAMKKSKILLHTSAYEGQGLVLAEALANGCYVVCFPVGAFPPHHKVRVCHSALEMQNEILAILALENPDYTPVFPFSIQDTMDKWLAVYKDILG